MAYKVRLGHATMSGSLGTDDLVYSEDPDTGIDFEPDTIKFETGGTERLVVTNNGVGIGTTSPDYTLDVAGDIGVDQKIYHNGDANTYINFTDDRIRFEAGGLNLFGMHKKGSAPHQVTVNNGNNNVDFVVNTNDANTSPLLRCDASAGKVGIGTATPSEILTLNATDPTIRFEEGGTFKATIGVNSADNILIENKTMNKHIVFKANDQGTVREGLRLDGAVPEVVVNQQHGVSGDNSLIDFRVESESSTHMFFVDGSADKIGINTSTPHSGLQIDNSVAFATRAITQNHTVTVEDHTIFANATSTNITVTLPTAANIIGRQYVIKRVDSSGATSVTIDPDGSETIEGATTMTLPDRRSVVIQSDNNNWWIVAEYISPP
jgi:hypothetical protein